MDSRTSHCVSAPWGPDLIAVAMLTGEEELAVALLRPSDGQAVAQGRIAALTLAPIWSPVLRLEPLPWLAPGATGVILSNGYFSTDTSLTSQALHVMQRRGDVLLPALAVLRRAAHSRTVRCRPGQSPPCRQSWTRRWRLTAAGPGSDQHPPNLMLRGDGIVSRHRWAGQGYSPPVFERTPPIPPS